MINVAVEIGGTSVYEIDGAGTEVGTSTKAPASIIRMLSLLSKT